MDTCSIRPLDVSYFSLFLKGGLLRCRIIARRNRSIFVLFIFFSTRELSFVLFFVLLYFVWFSLVGHGSETKTFLRCFVCRNVWREARDDGLRDFVSLFQRILLVLLTERKKEIGLREQKSLEVEPFLCFLSFSLHLLFFF